jgi:6-phosphogluconolactonase
MNEETRTPDPSVQVTWAARADSEAVADYIAAIVEKPGACRLAVPGGKTPVPVFAILSKRSLPWGTVTLMLTDDRIVPENHPASNQGKLAAAFDATPAHVLPLGRRAIAEPFDLVWLGMGADGHIASLFPKMLKEQRDGPAIIKTTPDPLPIEAPFERLSLNMDALINTKEIMLLVRGSDKKYVLEEAMSGNSDLPIAQLIRLATCPITIFWSRS